MVGFKATHSMSPIVPVSISGQLPRGQVGLRGVKDVAMGRASKALPQFAQCPPACFPRSFDKGAFESADQRKQTNAVVTCNLTDFLQCLLRRQVSPCD